MSGWLIAAMSMETLGAVLLALEFWWPRRSTGLRRGQSHSVRLLELVNALQKAKGQREEALRVVAERAAEDCAAEAADASGECVETQRMRIMGRLGLVLLSMGAGAQLAIAIAGGTPHVGGPPPVGGGGGG